MSSNDNNHKQEGGSPKKKGPAGEDFPIQEYRLVPVDEYEARYGEEDEIDLIELAKTIWENRKIIYKFVAVGAVLGVLVALLTPKEYVSSATLMPEYSTESQSGASSLLQRYGGLIGLSGGSYSANSNAIRVELYPQIVQSLTFQDNLARQEFYLPEEDTTATLYEYFLEIQRPGVFGALTEYTIGLPGKLIKSLSSSEQDSPKPSAAEQEEIPIVELSREEMEVIEELRERVSASLNEESGVVSVSAKMRNPKLAAEIAKYTIEELTAYLTEYRTEKVLIDLEFIEEQLEKARQRFEETQLALADFEDSNLGSLTARAATERQRLQSEYDIAFNVYNTLTQQYEEAKLKVQEETPVFKVLQPVQVPVEDETSGAMVLIVFVMLSGFASIGWIFIQQFLASKSFD